MLNQGLIQKNMPAFLSRRKAVKTPSLKVGQDLLELNSVTNLIKKLVLQHSTRLPGRHFLYTSKLTALQDRSFHN